MEDLRRQWDGVLTRMAALEAQLAEARAVIIRRDARLAELESQVAELTVELQRRKKGFRPKAQAISRPKKEQDGRKVGERKHPGSQRPEVPPSPTDVVHDLRADACPHCGGTSRAARAAKRSRNGPRRPKWPRRMSGRVPSC